jgi:hypothetical protein
MWFGFALAAAFLTAFLPILKQRLLGDTPIAAVAPRIDAPQGAMAGDRLERSVRWWQD